MPLPETIRVKLSSEAAEYVSLTPVVVQEMPLRDLVEHMLGVTGKDEVRICDLLLRGTLVSGASRFRWTGWVPDPAGVRALLTAFPDPDPTRPFYPAACTRAVLRGPRQPVSIPREAASRRGILDTLLRRSSFWDHLMSLASSGEAQYTTYSYRDRADVFTLPLTAERVRRLHRAVSLLRYTALQAQIKNTPLESAELYVVRK